MVKYVELNPEQIANSAASFCRALQDEGGATADEAGDFERQMLALPDRDIALVTMHYSYLADRQGRQDAFAEILGAWSQAENSLSGMLAEVKIIHSLEDGWPTAEASDR